MEPSRTILRFERDAEGEWVAWLDCHHRRHLRHRPPLSSFPWLAHEAERHARLGAPIECGRCAQREWPEGLERYRETKLFDHDSVPAGLLREHSTKAGVWGRLELDAGSLCLHFADLDPARVELRAGEWAAIPPALPHHLELRGPAQFRVAFYRPALASAPHIS